MTYLVTRKQKFKVLSEIPPHTSIIIHADFSDKNLKKATKIHDCHSLATIRPTVSLYSCCGVIKSIKRLPLWLYQVQDNRRGVVKTSHISFLFPKIPSVDAEEDIAFIINSRDY